MSAQPNTAPEPSNPYVGPQQFEEKHANYYFGRDREARDLLSVVIAHRLVLFYSPSGAGKSSLLRVRLIPGLRSKEVRYLVLPLARVGGVPVSEAGEVENVYAFNLMASIDRRKEMAGVFSHMCLKDFMLGLRTSDGISYSYDAEVAAAALAERQDTGSTPAQGDRSQPPHVLIIDQFEEIVTTHPARWPEREAFFDQINQALADDPELWVVLSMRSDYVPEIERYTPRLPNFTFVRFAMERMGEKAAYEAVERPAAQAGRGIDPDAAQEIVRNLLLVREQHQAGEAQTGEFVQPVQLQVVCYQMWERLKDAPGKTITIDDLKALAGGDLTRFVDNALGDFYEDRLRQTLAIEGVDVAEAELRTWFSDKLITEAGTRGFLNKGKTETEGMPNQVVEFLEDKYLLRVEARAGAYWYELVHDRFIEPIRDRNRVWLLQNAQPLVLAARAWIESGRDIDRLRIDDNDLTKAVAAAQGQRQSPEVEEFLEARAKAEMYEARRRADESQKREKAAEEAAAKEREQKGLFRLVAAIAAIMGVLALFFALLSNNNAQDATAKSVELVTAVFDAKVAQATAEAAEAESLSLRLADQSLQSDDVEKALAFAIYANQVASQTLPSKAEAALAQALYASPTRARRELGSPIFSSDFDTAHQMAIAGQNDGSVAFWDLAGGEVVTVTEAHTGTVWSVALSPDASHALSAGDDGRVLYWDLSNHTSSLLPGEFGDKVFSVAFLPDGQHALFGGADSKLHLWNLDAKKEIKQLTGHDDWVYSVAVSPDGRQAVSGSEDQSMILWDLESGQMIGRLGGRDAKEGHHDWVRAVAFGPDGKTALSGSRHDIILWDLESGAVLRDFPTGGYMVFSLAFMPEDSSKFLSGGEDGVNLWDVGAGEAVSMPSTEVRVKPVRAIAPAGGAWSALAGGLDGKLQVLDLGAGAAVASFGSGAHSQQPPQECGMTSETAEFGPISVGSRVILGKDRESEGSMVWSSEMDRYVGQLAQVTFLLGADSDRGCPVVQVDIDGGRFAWRIRDMRVVDGSAPANVDVRSLAASSDGRYALTGSSDGSLTLWDASVGRRLSRWPGHNTPVTEIAFVDDNRAVSGAEDGSLRLWDVTTSQELNHWPESTEDPPGSPIKSLVISHNGNKPVQVSAITEDGRFVSWLPERNTSTLTRPDLKGETIAAAGFSDDASEAIVSLSGGSLQYWDDNDDNKVQQITDLDAANQATNQTTARSGSASRQCEPGRAANTMSYRGSGGSGLALVASGNCVKIIQIDKRPTRGPDGKEETRYTFTTVASLFTTDETGANTTGQVYHLSFVADGSSALMGSETGLWHWQFGEDKLSPIATSTQNPVSGKFVAANGSRTVVSDGSRLFLYDLATGQALHRPATGPALALAAEPGKALVGGESGVIVWDWLAPSGEMTKTLIHAGDAQGITAIASAGQDRFVSGSYTGTLALRNSSNGETLASTEDMTRPVTSLAVSPSRHLAAAGDGSGALHAWNFQTGQKQALPPPPVSGPHKDAILDMAFDADGKRLLAGDRDGRVILWDIAGGKSVELADTGLAITSVTFSPNGRQAWLGMENGLIAASVVETRQWRKIAQMEASIQSLDLSPDGQLGLFGGADGSLVLWDAQEQMELARFDHKAPLWQAAFAQDAGGAPYAIASDASGMTRAWSLALPPDAALLEWVTNNRIVAKLNCAIWEEIDIERPASGCTDSTENVLAFGPTPSPAPTTTIHTAEAPTPARSTRVGQQRGSLLAGSSEVWRLTGSRGQALAIQVTPDRPAGDVPASEQVERGKLALQVELRPPIGDPIRDPRFVVLQDGDYDLVVSSVSPSSSGPYTLTLTLPQQLDQGREKDSDLTAGERDLWSFKGERGQIVRVDMTSDDFDTYLELLDPEGRQVAVNDDFQGIGWSQLSDISLSSSGTYTIIARSYSDSGYGDYRVMFDSPDAQRIGPTEPRQGSFDLPTTWTFEGQESQLVGITLESVDASSSLPAFRLLGPGGTEIARADNSGQGSTVLPLVVLPSTSQYTIIPSAQGSTGSYTISLTTPEVGTIGPGETVEQDISEGVAFELVGVEGKAIIIRLDKLSEDIDPFLTVLEADGTQRTDDDSGGNLNSLLSLAPSTGRRIIVPKALGGRTSGRYRLTVSADALSELGGSAQAIQRLNDLATSSSTQSNLTEALELYQRIQELGGADIPLATLNRLCWFGSLNGLAGQVIDICEQLVQEAERTAPDRLHSFRDSRGLALALTGNRTAAIDDFRYAAETVGSSREEWVRRLEAGEAVDVIFDDDTLEALKNE